MKSIRFLNADNPYKPITVRAYISDLNIFLPDHIVSSLDIEKIVNENGDFLPSGSIERLFGVRNRRFAADSMQVSDLAVNAARQIIQTHGAENIDCLIFASASSDLIEPATANIIQQKLGLQCPAFDVKNACNSFVTALHIASSFITSHTYKKILIVSGEKPSNSIQFKPSGAEELKKRLASFSFGDGGSAVMLEPSIDECGLYFQKFKTVGKHWELCTIKGGGSMHPFEVEKNYFEGRTSELAQVIIEEGAGFLETCFAENGWQLHDIDHVITHQVSAKSFEALALTSGFPLSKIIQVCEEFGNTASVSIPLSLYIAQQKGILKRGDKIAVIGLAAGISLSVQLMVWK